MLSYVLFNCFIPNRKCIQEEIYITTSRFEEIIYFDNLEAV
jgi:hypothetical protein